MTHPQTSRTSSVFFLTVTGVVLLLFFATGWSETWSRPSLQGNEKLVIRDLPDRDEPLQLDVKIKGKPVVFGKALDEESDWLKGFTVTVKNKSDKPVTYARIDLIFPETKASGPALLYQLFLGQRADVPTLKNPPLYLLPNEKIDVSLVDQFDKIKELIEGRAGPVETINQVRIGLGEAMFADGTLYFGGRLFKRNPDPNDRRKWIKISEIKSGLTPPEKAGAL